jgi:capsular polysaccharide biosynthesis protein
MSLSSSKVVLQRSAIIDRNLPENFDILDISHFDKDLNVEIQEIHLLEIENALVIQRYIYKNLLIMENYVHTRGVTLPTRIKAFLKPLFFLSPHGSFDKGIWAIDTWSKGYFHWLTDFLPRCVSAIEYWPEYSVLLPSYFNQINYISESLEILPFRTTLFDISKSYKVKTLIVPSRLEPAQFDSRQIIQVRNFFKEFDSFNSKTSKRIYISRSRSQRRKVLNEMALETLLKNFGFEKVFMEDLSFKAQRKLMSETKILLSNHGAGLTNMMFLPNYSAVVELKANITNINNCYFNLARALEHDYYYTMNLSPMKDVQKADISVDIEILFSLLNAVINK